MVPKTFSIAFPFSLLPTARPQTRALSSMADHTHMNKHGLTSAHISILAFQKITSYTGDLRALPLCLSEAGRGGGENKVNTDGSHMWLWKGNEEEVFRQRDPRQDWVGKHTQGVDVVPSVHARSCIHPPEQCTACGPFSANITLVTCGGVSVLSVPIVSSHVSIDGLTQSIWHRLRS